VFKVIKQGHITILSPLTACACQAHSSAMGAMHVCVGSTGYITVGWHISPIKSAPSHGGCRPRCNTWFVGATGVRSPEGISIGSAILYWSPSCPTHTQTRRPRHVRRL